MKIDNVRFAVTASVMLVGLVLGSVGYAQEALPVIPVNMPDGTEVPVEMGDNLWNRSLDQLRGRVEIGLRFKWYSFDDNKRPNGGSDNYLGSINAQLEDEDHMPLLFASYIINPYLSVGLTYDRASSITWTQAETTEEGEVYAGYTDGTINASGPVLFVMGYYPNNSIVTPFVELGVVFYSVKYDHTNPEWRNAYGIPNYQYMDPSIDMGYRIGAGVDVNVRDRLGVVVYLNQTWVEAELDQILRGRLHQSGTFPLDHISYGIGLKYRL
jgi:outer membrane protein W